jgi:hypothetical protein
MKNMKIQLLVALLFLFFSCKIPKKNSKIPDKTKIISWKKFQKNNEDIDNYIQPKCSKLFYNALRDTTLYYQNSDYLGIVIDSVLKDTIFKNCSFRFKVLIEKLNSKKQCISLMEFDVRIRNKNKDLYNLFITFVNEKIQETKIVKIYEKTKTDYVRIYSRWKKKGIYVVASYLKECEFSGKAPIHMETSYCDWRYSEIWQISDEGKFIFLGYSDKRIF